MSSRVITNSAAPTLDNASSLRDAEVTRSRMRSSGASSLISLEVGPCGEFWPATLVVTKHAAANTRASPTGNLPEVRRLV